jgi:hypothetical protein
MHMVLLPIRTLLSAGTLTTTTGGLTVPSGGLTAPIAEADGRTTPTCACGCGPTVSPTRGPMTPYGGLTAPLGGLTTHVAKADGPTTPNPWTALTSTLMPHMAMMTSTSRSMPRMTLTTPTMTSVPHAAPTTPPAASSVAPIPPLTAQPIPRMLLAGVVPISPMVHPHSTRTRGASGFWQPNLYITATLSPILKSVWATLANHH